jgi:hypothetical protein
MTDKIHTAIVSPWDKTDTAAKLIISDPDADTLKKTIARFNVDRNILLYSLLDSAPIFSILDDPDIVNLCRKVVDYADKVQNS